MRARIKYLLFLVAPVALAAPMAVPLPNAPPWASGEAPPIIGSTPGFLPGECERGLNGEITGPDGCLDTGPAIGGLPFQPVTEFGEGENYAFDPGAPDEPAEDGEPLAEPENNADSDQELIENAFWENTEDGAFGMVGPFSFTAGGTGGSLYFYGNGGGNGPGSSNPPGPFGSGGTGSNGGGFFGAFAPGGTEPGGAEPGGEDGPSDSGPIIVAGETGDEGGFGQEGPGDSKKDGAPAQPPGNSARDGGDKGNGGDTGGNSPPPVEIPGLPPGGSNGDGNFVTTSNGGGQNSGGQNGNQRNDNPNTGNPNNGGPNGNTGNGGGSSSGDEPFEVSEPHGLLLIAAALAAYGALRRRRARV